MWHWIQHLNYQMCSFFTSQVCNCRHVHIVKFGWNFEVEMKERDLIWLWRIYVPTYSTSSIRFRTYLSNSLILHFINQIPYLQRFIRHHTFNEVPYLKMLLQQWFHSYSTLLIRYHTFNDLLDTILLMNFVVKHSCTFA